MKPAATRSILVRPALMKLLVSASVALVLNLCLQDACRAAPAAGAGTCAGPDAVAEGSPIVELAAVPPVGTTAWAAAAWYKAQADARSSAESPAESSAPARLSVRTEGEDALEIPEAEDGEDDQGGGTDTPVYRTWWFWAAIGGAIAAVAVVGLIGGDSSEGLPDFPDPPDE
jgi:hypothetical protein